MHVASVELLYWAGCPSHPQALAELRAALAELGHTGLEVTQTEIVTEEQAAERAFIGSPTLRIGGVDPHSVVELVAGQLVLAGFKICIS